MLLSVLVQNVTSRSSLPTVSTWKSFSSDDTNAASCRSLTAADRAFKLLRNQLICSESTVPVTCSQLEDDQENMVVLGEALRQMDNEVIFAGGESGKTEKKRQLPPLPSPPPRIVKPDFLEVPITPPAGKRTKDVNVTVPEPRLVMNIALTVSNYFDAYTSTFD